MTTDAGDLTVGHRYHVRLRADPKHVTGALTFLGHTPSGLLAWDSPLAPEPIACASTELIEIVARDD